jgi:hypothetical protein
VKLGCSPLATAGAKDTDVTRRRLILAFWSVLIGAPLLWWLWTVVTYPSDRTPEGAYLRIVIAVNKGKPEDFFAYVETRAQHACYTIRDYRKKSRERVLAAYPEPERSRLGRAYTAEADAADGADVFALLSRQRGFLDRLRRDMSGKVKVEVNGERATLETAKGTRYPFRRRENGIWGLTLFTPILEAEAERAARDAALIERAAADYERVQKLEQRPNANSDPTTGAGGP